MEQATPRRAETLSASVKRIVNTVLQGENVDEADRQIIWCVLVIIMVIGIGLILMPDPEE